MVAALVLALVGGAGLVALRARGAKPTPLGAAWLALARDRGGVIIPDPLGRLEIPVGAVPVNVEVYDVGDLARPRLRTQVRAPAFVPPGLVLRGGWRRGRKLEPITLHETVVRTDEPDAVATVWTPAVAAAWRRIGTAALLADGQAVTCEVEGVVDDRDVLDAMIEVVSAVAGWDRGLAAMLASLPDASPVEGRTLLVRLVPDGVRVGLREIAIESGAARHVVVELDGPLRRRVVAATVARGRVVRQRGEVPAAAREHLPLLGDASVSATATGAMVRFPTDDREAMFDVPRLRAAIAVVRAFAPAAHRGPYR